jgi:cellulose synthase/poly-beta-1,6-N-acetylglucosamine synthase-like glycosyltransferase
MSSESFLFWLSVGILGYTYLGYPAFLWAWASLRPRPPRRGVYEPRVSLVVAAHNEANRIQGRIQNLLSLDYPRDRLEILVGVDGATDGTAEAARAYESDGVRVSAYEIRRGKPAVLNDLVAKCRGEIVVFADARQRFDVGALRALVSDFADPAVGAVSGELMLTDSAEGTPVGKGVGCYWRYEKFIRGNESSVDSAVGATGAIYAIRRDLFQPIPGDTVLDDVLIPMQIARGGSRVLFEPGARAYDRVAASAQEEFTRKVRTIAGNFQLFARERWLLNPWRNRLWLQTVSHKGLRLLTPLFLLTAFGANLLLLDSMSYRITMGAQILFYAAAMAGHALRGARRKIPFLSVPCVLCLLSWATVIAFFRFVTGHQPVTWETASAC